MITKISKDNAEQSNRYSALFAKASRELGLNEEDEAITTLEEYFSHITDLIQKDICYTILPLDEETLDINANTREITIPSVFKQGAGVVGDQGAEFIYFTIDRFFDSMDLDTQNIYIEWRNADGVENRSKPWAKDLVTLPGKIIFGWALGEEMTSTAGQLEFAVRFYTVKDDQIVYSFSTLPAKITINKTMNFDLLDNSIDTVGDEFHEMIISRFQDSQIVNSSGTAEAPLFSLKPEDVLASVTQVVDSTGNIYYETDLDENGQLRLKAQAYSTDAGSISYRWQRKKLEALNDQWYTNTNGKIVFELTKDTDIDSTKIYYVKSTASDDKTEGYEEWTGDSLPVENSTVYEKFSVFDIEASKDEAVTGYYRVIAKNRVSKATAETPSSTISIPGPELITLTDNNYGYILTDGILNKTMEAVVADGGSLPEKGVVSYQWYTIEGSNYAVIEGATGKSYTPTEAGSYYVKATHTRNGSSLSDEFRSYRVTEPTPEPVILSQFPATFDTNLAISQGKPFSVSINIEALGYKDSKIDDVTVFWYKVDDTDGDKILDLTKDTLIDGSENHLGIGNNTATYMPEVGGVYSAQIVVSINGDTNSKILDGSWTAY